jgi:hypothetical protein
VIIINNPPLLTSLSALYTARDFTVFPFYKVEEVPEYLFSVENLFLWEIEEINPANLKWIEFLKEKKTIRFILIDFLRDVYLLNLFKKENYSQDILLKSFKIRDLIYMSCMLFDENYPFINLNSYLNPEGRIYAREIKKGNNYLETAQRIIYQFLMENHFDTQIKDIDLFLLALGEVVENFVEYQLHQLKKQPDVILEYGFDNEKVIVSARDKIGAADFSPLFNSFIRKSSVTKKDTQNSELNLKDYNQAGIYVGGRGRGMNIIKKSVHRLISIVKRDSESLFEKRTQFIFIVYLDKKETEGNSSVNMLVFF